MSPIVLQPIYQTRVWGGRNLETIYGRDLPGDESFPVGESWDVVDRPEAQSVVCEGEYAGRTLGELWREERKEIFGDDAPDKERFPMLCKILDVQQNLSVQVHPPAGIAEEPGGEPKSEFWYAARAEDGALWYAGLKAGITRDIFEGCVKAGTTPECLHQLSGCEGNGLYVPSGRVHALGAGQIIFEIQENSDTTYRIFDWDRKTAGEVKRELQIEEALQSIDFADTGCVSVTKSDGCLIDGPEFRIQKHCVSTGEQVELPAGAFSVIALVSGGVVCGGHSFKPGDYFLIPANTDESTAIASSMSMSADSVLLQVTWPG